MLVFLYCFIFLDELLILLSFYYYSHLDKWINVYKVLPEARRMQQQNDILVVRDKSC